MIPARGVLTIAVCIVPTPIAGQIPMCLSLLDPRPDVKRIDTDANQVRWNKAKLRCAKADYANNHAVDNGYQESRPRFPADENSRQYSEKAGEII